MRTPYAQFVSELAPSRHERKKLLALQAKITGKRRVENNQEINALLQSLLLMTTTQLKTYPGAKFSRHFSNAIARVRNTRKRMIMTKNENDFQNHFFFFSFFFLSAVVRPLDRALTWGSLDAESPMCPPAAPPPKKK